MEELNYVYDRVAANLRTLTSTTVGLIVTEIANPYFSEVADGVHQALGELGYVVLLGATFDSEEKQDLLLATMMENRIGGLILSPVSRLSKGLELRLNSLGIPTVIIGRKPTGTVFDFVGIDNVYGAKAAVKHLIERGHRRIAFIGGLFNDIHWLERKEGYCQELLLADLDVDESLIINTPVTRSGGVEGIKQMLNHSNRPTALLCYNDLVAFGVMSALKELGISPGSDLAVIGFDNIPEAAETDPKLTTVSLFPNRIGSIAANLLHQRMKGFDDEQQDIIIQPKLVVRESG